MNGTILRMQLWELWRLTRQEILWRALFAVLMFGAVYGFCTLVAMEPGDGNLYYILMSLAYVGLAFGAAIPFIYSPALAVSEDWRQFLRSQYARPITTFQLLGVPLAYDVALRLAGHTALAWMFVACSGLNLPLGAVVLFVSAAGAVLFLAAAAYSGPWVFLGSLVVGAGVLFAVLLPDIFHGYALLESSMSWWRLFALSLFDWTVLLGLVAVFGGYALRNVDVQRHGARAIKEARISPLDGGDTATERRSTPFGSPFHAQLWMELRRTADLWQAVLLLVPLSVGLTALASWWGLPAQFYAVLWLLTFILGPAVFILAGATQLSGMKLRAGDARLSVFEATQTLPIGQSIALKASVLFCMNALGSLVIIVAAVLSWRFFPPASLGPAGGKLTRMVEIAAALDSIPALLALASIGATGAVTLILLSLCGTYASQRAEMGGRIHRADLVFSGIAAGYLVLLVFDRFSDWNFALVWIATAWSLAVGLVFAAAWGLWRLYNEDLMPTVVFGGALLVWLAFLVGVVYLTMEVVPAPDWSWSDHMHVVVFCVGLLFTPLAGFAWAPLAMMHRRSA